jgi:hypothetical protein
MKSTIEVDVIILLSKAICYGFVENEKIEENFIPVSKIQLP